MGVLGEDNLIESLGCHLNRFRNGWMSMTMSDDPPGRDCI
jgi:hypothetical protein